MLGGPLPHLLWLGGITPSHTLLIHYNFISLHKDNFFTPQPCFAIFIPTSLDCLRNADEYRVFQFIFKKNVLVTLFLIMNYFKHKSIDSDILVIHSRTCVVFIQSTPLSSLTSNRGQTQCQRVRTITD